MKTIAFIGLGHMGKPMALNLQKAGHALRVYDLQQAAMDELAAGGAVACESVLEAIQGASVVITMLPAGKHVNKVYTGPNGIITQVDQSALLIDCSTIDAATSRQLSAQAQARGLVMVDAPVSGGTGGAKAGTLTFIVGGSAEGLEQARPYLEKMGKAIFHAGDAGAGQVAKACNNMLLGILMAGTAEALALGVSQGLDPSVLSGIIAQSSGRNWATELYNPWPGVMEHAPASNNYAGGFGVDLMLKDLGLATESAVSVKAATPLGELARNLYALHSGKGHGGEDFSSILKLYQQAQ
ncbi:3-hydroxyisobutyrate dehydrogenase [Alcaligenes endophyticus]|uniref:3-hydroxyisobutyrate dehydrogenase n=1 Tax=Alcaligenes endophyticus TaxID=1929088 RepID=A0ABT8EJF3_9BURK|nr:3-hydroxyisobutyrate dehydrogenase [Alcaligenes endophyticus]MCX5591724.1 3-hydroxyisobutyrate dehydrogenase [Alcaligenes endophyticus]MDN4121401.1 3-hydroxyisobutyrate dehydrogenase [Alcaligenes endophyticus]